MAFYGPQWHGKIRSMGQWRAGTQLGGRFDEAAWPFGRRCRLSRGAVGLTLSPGRFRPQIGQVKMNPADNSGCERCGSHEAQDWGGQRLCDTCVAEAGSCCPGLGCDEPDTPANERAPGTVPSAAGRGGPVQN